MAVKPIPAWTQHLASACCVSVIPSAIAMTIGHGYAMGGRLPRCVRCIPLSTETLIIYSGTLPLAGMSSSLCLVHRHRGVVSA